jgi:hypothetical protein
VKVGPQRRTFTPVPGFHAIFYGVLHDRVTAVGDPVRMNGFTGLTPEKETTMNHRMRTPMARTIALTMTILMSSALAPAAHATGRAGPRVEVGVLADIAEDVLRRAASSPERAIPAAVSPDAAAMPGITGEGSQLDPDPPFAHMAPAEEAASVPVELSTLRAPKGAEKAAVRYESNSWRQRRDPRRSLSFSSGVLPLAKGLDPALQAHAAALSARGDQYVYGFVLLRDRLDEPTEDALARLGAELLGRHDDTYKARLPVASLAAIAAMPEVEWVGVSPPYLKQSLELAAVRGAKGAAAGIGAATPLPIFVNLFEADDTGYFRRELEAAGAKVGAYDPGLHFYRAVATGPVIEKIAAFDFVLFIELIEPDFPAHDQSIPMIDGDVLRPGTPLGHTRYSGAPIPVGIMDSGFKFGPGGHQDLALKAGCAVNFTTDSGTGLDDGLGHGTHILGTIAGEGAASHRFKGMAPGVGSSGGGGNIKGAKIYTNAGMGNSDWSVAAMDWFATAFECNFEPPMVINYSGGGSGVALNGTDLKSRRLDEKVWNNAQLYVVAAGNDGPGPMPGQGTVNSPGVAKNALTVGSVLDNGYMTVGDLAPNSSRGPTGDHRMKPNVVAPGAGITSTSAVVLNSYIPLAGTSFATPHVTGLAATLMHHYPDFKFKPALMRAHLMATALGHDGAPGRNNEYGAGRVSSYLAHWDHNNSDGWFTQRFWGNVNATTAGYREIVVPPNTHRLVVVMTWGEPPASAGASFAMLYDLDLWVDHGADCGLVIHCGEYYSNSGVDGVEYVVINQPPAGVYALKVRPFDAPTHFLPFAMVAHVVRGDPKPLVNTFVTAPPNAAVGSTFDVTFRFATDSYVTSGVHAELITLPNGVTPVSLKTTRHDGVVMDFPPLDGFTLGNLVPMLGRSATWTFRATSPGPKNFTVRAWSENSKTGDVIATATVQAVTPLANLTQMGVTPNGASVMTPGTKFSVSDSVQNDGAAEARSSTTRYYVSLDAVKNAGDTLLSGTRSVPALAVGAFNSGTATVTIPDTTPLGAYYVLACADDRASVAESDEANNCVASAAVLTVTRPDLVVSAVSNPPATAARGSKFSVTDTAQNVAAVGAASSKMRYYLSLNAVKSADDRLMTTSRSVPALAAGAVHSGTVLVTVPSGTPPNSYFVLVCADGHNAVEEASEDNNCRASGTQVTISP